MIISEIFESPGQCPECGGISFSDLILAEKKDACYHKIKATAKVWPSAYASGRLVQCRKKGAANYGNKSEGMAEEYELAGVGVAYDLGRQAYRERKTIRDNPYSATKEARKYDEWEKGLERGKHDANDAKLFRNSVREQGVAEGIDELARVLELSGLNLTPDEQFDIIEDMVESIALEHGVDAETIWEEFESVDDHELFETAAWQKKSGKSKSGGLNAKGVASYRRENPGSKLQMAVTTKPSKLKPGSKAAKRRKSFCARMGGNKGPMKKPNGKPTRKALALRKWNC